MCIGNSYYSFKFASFHSKVLTSRFFAFFHNLALPSRPSRHAQMAHFTRLILHKLGHGCMSQITHVKQTMSNVSLFSSCVNFSPIQKLGDECLCMKVGLGLTSSCISMVAIAPSSLQESSYAPHQCESQEQCVRMFVSRAYYSQISREKIGAIKNLLEK